MSKKGQITIFIIIGVVLLLLVSIILYTSSTSKKEIFKSEIEKSQIEKSGIQLFTEACISQVLIRGFKKLGQQGGWIYSEGINKNLKFDEDNPTDSDGIKITDDYFIPYWFYMVSPNGANEYKMNSLAPRLQDMEFQLSRFLEENLPACLDDFYEFRKDGFFVSTGELSTTVFIGENDVSVKVKFPVTALKLDKKMNLDEFLVRINFNLKSVLDLAFEINWYEANLQFLENSLLSLISVYGNIPDKKLIPPIGWQLETNSPKSWAKSTIKKRIENYLLLSHIGTLRFKGTKDGDIPVISEFDDQFNQNFLVRLRNKYPNLRVSVLYDPKWSIYLDITPSENGIVEPSIYSNVYKILPSTQSVIYESFYDVSFPVLVIISDDRSLREFGETGFVFMFALEGNIRDNVDILQWSQGQGTIGTTDYSNTRITVLQSEVLLENCTEEKTFNVEYNLNQSLYSCSWIQEKFESLDECRSKCISKNVTEKEVPNHKSLFCRTSQEISAPVKLTLKNKINNRNLNGVSVKFGCGNYRICPMGVTNNKGILFSRFPICEGGYLFFEKEHFLSETVFDVSTSLLDPINLDIGLYPVIQKEIKIKFLNTSNLFKTWRLLSDTYGCFLNDSLLLEPVPLHVSTLNRTLMVRQVKSSYDSIRKYTNFYSVYREKVRRDQVKDATRVFYSAIDVFVANPVNTLSCNYSSISTKLKTALDSLTYINESFLLSSSYISKFRNSAGNLKKNESIFLTMSREEESPLDTLNKPFAILSANSSDYVTLVPGKYSFNIIAFDKKKIEFPEVDFVLSAENNYSTSMPNQTYGSPIYSGGSIVNNETFEFVVDEDIYLDGPITFYAFRFEDPTYHEDIFEMNFLELFSRQFRAFIEPDYIS